MRILQVVHQFPPEKVGGTEIYTQGLARQLRKCGHEMIVLYRGSGTRSPIATPKVEGIKRYEVEAQADRDAPLPLFLLSFRNLQAERIFAQVLDWERPDLVHFQHLMGLSPRFIPMAGSRRIATVLTLHDYWFLCPNAQLILPNGRSCSHDLWGFQCVHCFAKRVQTPPVMLVAPLIVPLLAYRTHVLRRRLREMDVIIAPTSWTRDIFNARGYSADKIKVIGHGISELVHRSARCKVRLPLRFAYLGGIAWQKGVHVLIRAFQGIKPGQAVLTIYGDQRAFPEYTKELQRMAEGSAVSFGGQIEHAQVGAVLTDVDALIVPSLWPETSCLVVQEAFAAQVPVIASDIGALREKVRHGVDGLLFTVGNTTALRALLRELISHPCTLEELRCNIRPQKTMGEHAAEVEALYAQLLREKRFSR
jgi:glycosyltransferase involved in cell wall biosynthesis